MSEQDNMKAAHSFFDAWNAGDLSKTAAYEADDFISENAGMPAPMNAEQNRKFNQVFLTAFPGSKFEVMLDIPGGEYFVTHWKVSGLHNGPLQTPSGGSIPPTGKAVTIVGSTTYQLQNGKIKHSWAFWDMSSLLMQIGLLPPM
jgi:steroid delta-isomerase-like uncharacterized protein